MPTTSTYNYSESRRETTIRCGHGCGTSRTYAGSDAFGAERDLQTGEPVSETFRYLRTQLRYHTICRACERSRQAARPRRPRVPASAAPGTALGTGRRFGVELELIATVSRERVTAALAEAGLNGWRTKYDGSLSAGGIEVVSPVLAGEEGERQVREACRVLAALGCRPNRSCGLHVHHEINDLSIAQVKTLARNWHASQSLIDGLVSESRRGGRNQYCRPLGSDTVAQIDRCRDLQSLRRLNVSRYHTLNLAAFGRYGTVEIRQHQGTVSAEKVISWIRFGQAMIDTAKVAGPVTQTGTVRSMLTGLADRLDETARTFLLGRAVEFNAAPVM